MTQPQDLPQDELQELQSLLRLKNYEQPAEGYHEDFLEEFHRRQRLEKRTQAAQVSLGARLSAWFQGLGAARWAIGAAGAYAALFLAFLALPDANQGAGGSDVVENPATVLPGDRQLEHVELEKVVEDEDESVDILPSGF